MKKYISLIIVLVMILAMCLPVYADEVPTSSAQPTGLVLEGNSIIAVDSFNKQIVKGDGINWTVIAGKLSSAGASGEPIGLYKDGVADEAYFKSPYAIVPIMKGYAISDTEANVIRYFADGRVQTLVNAESGLLMPTGLAAGDGKLYIADTGNDRIVVMDENGKLSVLARDITDPTGLSYADGVLYICETGKNRILSITDGKIAVVCGRAIEDEDGEHTGGYVNGLAAVAQFDHPQAVLKTADALYIADTGNMVIRVLRDGRVTTVAEPSNFGYKLTDPRDMAFADRKLYIADPFYPQILTCSIAANTFSDVKAGEWYKDAVNKASQYWLIAGYPDGTFKPQQGVTRAEFLTMLSRTQHFMDGGIVINGKTELSDVESGKWYYKTIGWADANGYLENLPGISEGKALPNQAITRDEFALVVYNYAVKSNLLVKEASAKKIAEFKDSSDVQFKDAMQWAVRFGLITGFEDNTLRPQGLITRAQAAAILSRFIESAGF